MPFSFWKRNDAETHSPRWVTTGIDTTWVSAAVLQQQQQLHPADRPCNGQVRYCDNGTTHNWKLPFTVQRPPVGLKPPLRIHNSCSPAFGLSSELNQISSFAKATHCRPCLILRAFYIHLTEICYSLWSWQQKTWWSSCSSPMPAVQLVLLGGCSQNLSLRSLELSPVAGPRIKY